jgi:hypothetical protein
LVVTQVMYPPEALNARPSCTSELFESTLSSNARQLCSAWSAADFQ